MTAPPSEPELSANRWLAETGGTRGPEYAARFAELAQAGEDVHGEARLVDRLVREVTGGGPGRVLDAGCGTGRVAVELARRGHTVTGVDVDASMLDQARDAGAGRDVTWHLGDLLDVPELVGGDFDVVAAPGNVMVYLTPGTEADVVRTLVQALRPGGLLVAGFVTDRHVSPQDHEGWCRAAGAEPVEGWATWGQEPLLDDALYAVLVHRR
jgi:SAM-dependent methyltransferase